MGPMTTRFFLDGFDAEHAKVAGRDSWVVRAGLDRGAVPIAADAITCWFIDRAGAVYELDLDDVAQRLERLDGAAAQAVVDRAAAEHPWVAARVPEPARAPREPVCPVCGGSGVLPQFEGVPCACWTVRGR